MADLGNITLKLSADFGDVLSQLSALSASIDSAFGSPDTSGITGAVAGVSSALDGLAAKAKDIGSEIGDAFANTSITIPTGSLMSDSAAADIVKEIALAFETTPINLSIDTSTAGSAASDVAAEVAQAFGSIEISAPDVSAFSDALGSIGDAASEEAAQIAQEFSSIQVSAPDTSAISDESQSGGGEIIEAPDFQAPDTGAITDALSEIDTAAAGAVDEMVSDFSGAELAAPDDSAIAGEFSDLESASETAAEQVSADFSGVGVDPPDLSGITDAISGVDDAASTSADDMVADFSGASLEAPDTSAISDSFTGVETDASDAADQMGQDFSGAALEAPDTSAIADGLSEIDSDAAATADQMGQDFSGAQLQAPDTSAITGDFTAIETAAETAAGELSSAFSGAAVQAPDLSGLSESISQAGDAAQTAATGEDAFYAALNTLVGEGNSLDDAFKQLTGSTESFTDALGSGSLAEFAASFGTLADDAAPVAGDMQQAETAVGEMGSAAETAGGQAAAAGGDLATLGDDAEHAGQGAEDAEGGLSGMAEQLTAVGEALVITEGLKELGSEALSAADGLTKAGIALTGITGDGEEAEKIIQGLEQLGVSDGLSLPSLLTAGTRMQQLLPEGTDVVGVLTNIADGAAVMGTAIDSAATKFDNMVNSGTIAARSLTGLGLNLQAIADALNVVNPALDATADSAAKAFKALDPGDRITVLQTALQQLGGTAQQVAEQTFGGQWQTLSDQWEQIMAAVGQALLPVISSLTSFASGVAADVKSLTDAFSSLPAPVQDAAAGFGVLVAAIIPVTGALAASSLAIDGLSSVATAAGGALSAIGAFFAPVAEEAGAAAVAEGALAVATEAEGTAAGLAVVGIEAETAALVEQTAAATAAAAANAAAAGSSGGVGVGAAAGGAAAIEAEAAAATEAGTAMEAGGAAAIAFSTGIGEVAIAAAALTIGLQALENALVQTGSVMPSAEQQWNDWGAAATQEVTKADDSLQDLADKSTSVTAIVDGALGDMANNFGLLGTTATSSLANAGSGFESLGGEVQAFLTSTANASTSISGLQGVVDALTDAVKNQTAINQSGYIPTWNDVAAAQAAVQAAIAKTAGTVQQATGNFTDYANAAKTFVDVTQEATTPIDNLNNSFDALNGTVVKWELSLGNAQQNLAAAVTNLSNVKTAYDDGEASIADYETALNNVATAQGKVTSASNSLATAQNAVDKAFDVKQIDAAGWNEFFSSLTGAALSAGDDLKDIGIDIDAVAARAPSISPLNQALNDLGTAASKPHPSIVQLEADLDALAAKAQDTGDWTNYDAMLGKVDADISKLGKTDLLQATDQFGQLAQKMIDGDAPLSAITDQMGKFETSIGNLSKTDMPNAIAEQQTYIGQLQQMNAPISQVIAAIEKWDTMQIQLAADSGTSSAAYIYNLEQMQLQQQQLAQNAAGMATSVVASINDLNKGFDTLGETIGQAIVDGNNLGDALVTAMKKVAASILGDLIQGALTPLKSALMDLEKTLLSGLDGGLNAAQAGINSLSDASRQTATQMAGMEGSIGDVEKDMESLSDDTTQTASEMAGLGSSAQQTSQTLGQLGTQQGQAGTGLIGSLQNLTNIISLVAQVIAAGAAVVGDVYLAAIDTKLFTVETDLNGILQEALNFRADQWNQFGQEFDRAGEILNTLETGLGNIYDAVMLLVGGGGGSSSSSGGSGTDPLQADLDQIASNTSLMVGSLGSIFDSVQAIQDTDSQILSELETTYSYLAVIDQSIDNIVTAIDYGGQGIKEGMTQQTGQLIGAGADHAAGIMGSLDTVTQTIQQQIAATQQQLSADQQAASAATNTADEITALQSELKDLQNLSSLEQQNGNSLMAQTYATQAAVIAGQITNLGGTVTQAAGTVGSDVTTSTANQTTALTSGLNQVTATQGTTSQNIVSAIDNSASVIAGAVTSGMAVVGQQLLQNVPRGGTGVNNTAGAVGGQPAGAGVSETSIPIPTPQFPGTGGTVVPNAPAANGATPPAQVYPGPQGTAVPLNYNPATGQQGGTGTQIVPNGAGSSPIVLGSGAAIPQLENGGFVAGGGIATVDTGEYMLNPGQVSDFLAAMTGPAPTGLDALAGAVNVAAQTAQQTAAEQNQKLIDQLALLQEELTGAIANGAAVEVYELKNQIQAVQGQLGLNPVLGPADTGNAQQLTDAAAANATAAANAAATTAVATTSTAASAATTATATSASAAVQQDQLALQQAQMALIQAQQSGNADQIALANAQVQAGQAQLAVDQDAAASAAATATATQSTATSSAAVQQAMAALQSAQLNLMQAQQSGNQQLIAAALAEVSLAQQNLALAQDAAAKSSAPSPSNASGAFQGNQTFFQTGTPQFENLPTSAPSIGGPQQAATPHAGFSGYNPYGENQPFIAGSFALGGPVPADGIYQLHANEFVLNPEDAAKAMNLGKGSSSGGSASSGSSAPLPGAGTAGQTFNAPMNFYGVTNAQQIAQLVTQQIKLVLPRAAIAGS